MKNSDELEFMETDERCVVSGRETNGNNVYNHNIDPGPRKVGRQRKVLRNLLFVLRTRRQ